MMTHTARHHFWVFPFFEWYTRFQIGSKFATVERNGSFADRQQPILLISNHMSWWDGFWALHLNQNVFKRKFHFMMQHNQLAKYWFFRYCGAIEVKKQSRSVLGTLADVANLLGTHNNLVLVFPQGKIESMHTPSFHFEKGIERIVNQTDVKELQIVMLANFIDYFSNSKPSLHQYFEEYKFNTFRIREFEECYNQFYKRCAFAQSHINQ